VVHPGSLADKQVGDRNPYVGHEDHRLAGLQRGEGGALEDDDVVILIEGEHGIAAADRKIGAGILADVLLGELDGLVWRHDGRRGDMRAMVSIGTFAATSMLEQPDQTDTPQSRETHASRRKRSLAENGCVAVVISMRLLNASSAFS